MLASENTRLEKPNICINSSLYFQTFSHNTTISAKNVIIQVCVCLLTISESRIKRCPTLRDLKNAPQVTLRVLQADTGPLIKTRSCFILSKSGGYNLQVGIHFILHNFFLLNLSGSLKSKLFAMGIFNGNFEKIANI